MPPHAYYAEPFAGSGAVLRRKPPALLSFVVEQDEEVLQWWRSLAWPGTIVVRGDGIQWLERMDSRIEEGDAHDWLVYCDPPYLPETRVKKRIYKHELTAERHVELLRRLNRLDCRVMVSGYPSKLYDQYLARWHVETREVVTRGGTMRTECLWCNFDPARAQSLGVTMPAAGDNFRERERIKRKRNRWRSRFMAMPPGERGAVLAALLDAERLIHSSIGARRRWRGLTSATTPKTAMRTAAPQTAMPDRRGRGGREDGGRMPPPRFNHSRLTN
jgi:hypothetical protein